MYITIRLDTLYYSEESFENDFFENYIYSRIVFLPHYDYIRIYYQNNTLLHHNRVSKYYFKL